MVVELPPELDALPERRRDNARAAWSAAGLAILLMAAAAGFGWWLRGGGDTGAVPVGDASDFALGAPVEVQVGAPYFDPVGLEGNGAESAQGPGERESALLFIVNHPDRGLLALSQRGPFLGCRVQVAAEADARQYGHEPPEGFVLGFIDVCHGGLCDLDGTHLAGPGSRNLDRFPVSYLPDGTVTVDLSRLQATTAS